MTGSPEQQSKNTGRQNAFLSSRNNVVPGDENGGDVDIRSMLLMLWRRKFIVIGIMLTGISLTIIALGFIQPRYAARALVLVENKNGPQAFSAEIQNLVNTVKLDTTLILNEIEVIRSRNMARKVIDRLNLTTDPEFNLSMHNPLEAGRTNADPAPNGRFKTFAFNRDSLKSVPEGFLEKETEVIVTRFLQALKVRSVPGSNVIEIEYESYNPSKAALIANVIADEYIKQRLEIKFQTARKVTDWLDKRLTELRVQVRESEEAVQKYKQENNIAEGVKTIASAEQLSEINTQLVSAKAAYAGAYARLKEIESLTQESGRIETVGEVINSRLIQELKQDETDLLRRLSDLSSRYGEKHPKIINLRKELRDLQKKISLEMSKIAESMRNEARVAEARVQTLQKSIDEIKQTRHENNRAMIKLKELVREAQSNRLIFDTFLQTYKRSDEQEELQEPEARVLSYAVAPREPSYPNKLLLLSLATALSLFIGLALAFLLEKLDNTFRSANQLERMTNYPCFALIPTAEKLKGKKTADYILSRPSSTVAESIRTLRTILNLRAKKGDKKPGVITITSSFPGEGKTTLSSWLARVAAKSGEKVVLIDADLRRPSIHTIFGYSNEDSLVEYLTGKTPLDKTIKKDTATGLDIIMGKSAPNSALDLISSRKMAQLIESLRETYNLVILDSPACLAVSDARVIAALSDQSLYAVAWDRTPREVVLGGAKQFADMNYESLAFVLTNVDVQKHVRYGYGDTVYYYGRYREYYAD